MENKEGKSAPPIHRVVVSMDIYENGAKVDEKKIDFGRMDKNALNELINLFALMAKDIEQVKKLGPQIRKLEKETPEYLK